jgi:hypothetical protein
MYNTSLKNVQQCTKHTMSVLLLNFEEESKIARPSSKLFVVMNARQRQFFS